MMMTTRLRGVALCVLAGLSGSVAACAPPDARFGSVQVLLQERAGLDAQWRQLSGDPGADRAAAELLACQLVPKRLSRSHF